MEKLKQLLQEYDLALFFGTNKEYDIRSIHSELDIKNQFIQKVKEIIEEDKSCFKNTEMTSIVSGSRYSKNNSNCEFVETPIKVRECLNSKCEKFRFYSFSYPENKNLHEEINFISYCAISRNAIINDVFVLNINCENFVIFRKLVENKKIQTIKELFNYSY